MKKYLILLALFVPLFVFGANTPQANNLTDSSRLYRTSFYLYAGSQYKFRTYSSTNDTVVHILNSSNSQVAYNDDCGNDCATGQSNVNSTATYTPTVSGTYYGILRHYYNGQVGRTATIKAYKDGVLLSTQTDKPVGGYKVSIDTWDAYTNGAPLYTRRHLHFHYFNRSKEETGGAEIGDTVMYLISGNTNITDYNDDGGAGSSSKIEKTSGSCSSGCKILGGAYPLVPQAEGNAKAIVDVETNFIDLDYDGVSGALETILGTSLSTSDTDEDGLSDYVETFGSEDVEMPWEGASATQKDIFIEVDYMGIDPNYNNPLYTDYFPAMKDFCVANYNDNILINMGYSFVQHGDTKIHIDVDDEIPFHKNLNCNNGSAGSDPINTNDLANDYFTSTRSGIYRWAIFGDTIANTAGVVGQSCGNQTMIVGLKEPFELNTNCYQNTAVFMHELGHDLSLGHNENDTVGSFCDNNSRIHRSLMNYHYVSSVFNNKVPRINAADSYWRYSTDEDGSYSSPVEEWGISEYGNYGDDWSMIWNSAGVGCVSPTSVSTKQECKDDPTNNRCDCTQNDYAHNLDYTGGGRIMESAMMSIIKEETAEMSEEERSDLFYNNIPVIGVGGQIIAENLNSLTENGKYYGKFVEQSFNNKVKKKDIKELFGEKIVKKYNDILKKEMEERGMKEGREFSVDEKGKIEFNGYKYGYQGKK